MKTDPLSRRSALQALAATPLVAPFSMNPFIFRKLPYKLEDFRRFLVEDTRTWAKVIRDNRIAVD